MLTLAPGELETGEAFAELVCAVSDGDTVMLEVEHGVRISLLTLSATILVREGFARWPLGC